MLATILAAGNGVGDSLKDPNLIHDTIVWGAKIFIMVAGVTILGLAFTRPKWGVVFSKTAIVVIGCAVIASPFLWDLGASIATKL